MVKNGKY